MINDLRNNIDFFLRNSTKFSRKNFTEKNPKLITRNVQENLYVKDLLERFLDKNLSSKTKILDIGSKNWFYAKAEYSFFESFCNDFFIEGVEIDAYRLYTNFFSRLEVAKYHTKDLKNIKYIPGNLLDIKNKYDYIIWILPFVLPEAHKIWGLPEKLFYPQKLFNHAYELLNNGGQMLIINQGETEAKAQKNILDKACVNYSYLGEITSCHFEYKNKRFGYKVLK